MSNLFLNFFSKRKCLPTAAATAAAPANSNSDGDGDGDCFSSSDDSISSSDLAGVLASRRFFFSSPGRSNSILESSSPPPPPSSSAVKMGKYSVDPYADFRRSMEEMIEAREMENVRSDWEYLEELLSCYLRLNPNHTHKFIITAFSDLLLSLLANSPAPS
ncbi:transcription repressor OFP12-like [Momordica charantia]|uniref:Transcription repressor n=1 Tax=Momordica charantia TaxID=3673 RepID=A0A6J1CA57_MOMCH|nr:transcription repressor OFP12-like [Momordica charantia]